MIKREGEAELGGSVGTSRVAVFARVSFVIQQPTACEQHVMRVETVYRRDANEIL